MNINPKSIAVVTGINSEIIDSKDPYDYCIGNLLDSGLFENIILTVPNKNNNRLFDLANYWGINFFAGSNFNVLDRIIDVARKYKPKFITRVQLRACWVDTNMLKESVELIRDGYDYIDYDYDINYAMGGDTFTYECLKKVKMLVSSSNFDEELKKTYEFSPWALMQNQEYFKVGIIKDIEMYDRQKVNDLKRKLNFLIGSEQNQLPVSKKNPSPRYTNLTRYIDRKDLILDIACGYGGGTAFLSSYCKSIYGVDIDKRYIDHAKRQNSNTNTNFILGNHETLLKMNISFDCIISLHTLEHVHDDISFIDTMYSILKTGGKFLLEVPRLLPKPLGEPLWPFHDKEYSDIQIKKILEGSGFKIIKAMGGNRNKYVNIKEAREVLFYYALKEG